jgi:hypothetical protein
MCVFVPWGFQHAMRMLYIVNCGLPRSTVFSHIISNGRIFFWGGGSYPAWSAFWLSPQHFVWNMSLWGELSVTLSEMYIVVHVKYRLLLSSNFNKLSIFSAYFRKKKCQTSNFIKISPLWAELLHTNRQTDRHDEANSRLSQFNERVMWM